MHAAACQGMAELALWWPSMCKLCMQGGALRVSRTHAHMPAQDRLAAHGVKLPEEELVWREELEEGIGQALNS